MGSACHRAARPLAESSSHGHQLFQPHPTPSRPLFQKAYRATELQNPQPIWSLANSDLGCVAVGKSPDHSEPCLFMQNGQQELKYYVAVVIVNISILQLRRLRTREKTVNLVSQFNPQLLQLNQLQHTASFLKPPRDIFCSWVSYVMKYLSKVQQYLQFYLSFSFFCYVEV